MRIKPKIILYQAIIAIMLLSMAVAAYLAIDRINYYSEWNRSTVEQMDTVIRLSAHMNRYSENIAELLLLGRTELDDFYAARSSLENDLAKLTSLAEQEVNLIRTAEERAVAGEELVRARRMRELFEDIDLVVQRLLFLRDEHRDADAIELFREQIEERLDAELEEHISAAIADEEGEIGFFEQRTHELQRRLTLLVSGVTLSTLLISTIAGASLTRALTRPICELISGARAIGEGNLSYRIKSDRNDEFADLAQQFNSTAAHLEAQRTQLLEVQAGLEKEVARRTNQLEDANARLQRLDQMRMLFLADIGHELRTPLTILRGEAEVVLRGKRSIEEYSEALQNVVQLSQQMGRLVEDLLFLARAEVGAVRFEMQRLVLQDVLDIAVREGRVLAHGARLLLNATVPAEPYEIEGDAERLMQAFLIVIDNAVKHSDPDGKIELSLDRDSGAARVAVSNTGPTIAPQELPYVFNRFYRGHRAVRRGTTGSGLGLPIAKWIVDAHGGRIAIASRDSKTELTIHIPLAA
jgi:signal transduction histidine kinase